MCPTETRAWISMCSLMGLGLVLLALMMRITSFGCIYAFDDRVLINPFKFIFTQKKVSQALRDAALVDR